VIVRLWRGRVGAARAEEYRVYQEDVGPPNYRVIPGIRRIYMLGRELGAEYEVAMLTLWESLEAIQAFAGEPVDRARYYERDFDFLIDPPDQVEHFEVFESGNFDPAGGAREKLVRLWRGRTELARRDEAIRLEKQVGVPGYRATPGNAGIWLLGREVDQQFELAMLTLWESLKAIRAFAGDPVDRAYYDEYQRRGFDYLIQAPETVDHFEVLVRERIGA